MWRVVITVAVACVRGGSTDKPPTPRRGHLLPFGSHRDPTAVPEVSPDISPQRFFDEYVDKNRPVIIRGAALSSPAMVKWVNDSGVIAEYGNLRVKLETKKEKDESSPMVGAEGGLGRASLRSWYQRLESKDTYVVSQLPLPMQKDVIIPEVLACHDAADHLLETNVWLSGGSTRSVIHKDADNALNCLVSGRKKWWFISPKWMNRGLPMADEEEAPGEIGGFSRLDVDAVDLDAHPEVQEVEYEYTEALPGDCVLVPWGYPHQVRSDAGRNVAFSLMFPVDTLELEPRPCPDTPLYLDRTSVFWDYDGVGEMTMGNSDPEMNRKVLLDFTMPPPPPSMLTSKTWPGSPDRITNPHLRQVLTMQRQSCLALDLIQSQGVPFIEVYSLYRRSVRPGYGYFGGGYGGALGWPCEPLADMTYLFEVANLSTATGRLTLHTAAALPREEVRQAMRCLMNTDPANTELFEYFLLNHGDVFDFVESAIERAPGHRLGRAPFLKRYVKVVKGTRYIGARIFDALDPEGTGYVTAAQFKRHRKRALGMFDYEL